MDQNLIALDTSLHWRVSPRSPTANPPTAYCQLPTSRPLYQLRHQPILNQPSEPDFQPDRHAVQWRLQRLLGA